MSGTFRPNHRRLLDEHLLGEWNGAKHELYL
jgi:hypothetical protein